jgi:hypothetical protein
VAVALTTLISWAIGFQHDTKVPLIAISSDKAKELVINFNAALLAKPEWKKTDRGQPPTRRGQKAAR